MHPIAFTILHNNPLRSHLSSLQQQQPQQLHILFPIFRPPTTVGHTSPRPTCSAPSNTGGGVWHPAPLWGYRAPRSLWQRPASLRTWVKLCNLAATWCLIIKYSCRDGGWSCQRKLTAEANSNPNIHEPRQNPLWLWGGYSSTNGSFLVQMHGAVHGIMCPVQNIGWFQSLPCFWTASKSLAQAWTLEFTERNLETSTNKLAERQGTLHQSKSKRILQNLDKPKGTVESCSAFAKSLGDCVDCCVSPHHSPLQNERALL